MIVCAAIARSQFTPWNHAFAIFASAYIQVNPLTLILTVLRFATFSAFRLWLNICERSSSYSLGAQQKTIACAAEARTWIHLTQVGKSFYIFGEPKRERKQKARHGDGFCATEYFHRRSAYFWETSSNERFWKETIIGAREEVWSEIDLSHLSLICWLRQKWVPVIFLWEISNYNPALMAKIYLWRFNPS